MLKQNIQYSIPSIDLDESKREIQVTYFDLANRITAFTVNNMVALSSYMKLHFAQIWGGGKKKP
jgi:hypothetical protein